MGSVVRLGPSPIGSAEIDKVAYDLTEFLGQRARLWGWLSSERRRRSPSANPRFWLLELSRNHIATLVHTCHKHHVAIMYRMQGAGLVVGATDGSSFVRARSYLTSRSPQRPFAHFAPSLRVQISGVWGFRLYFSPDPHSETATGLQESSTPGHENPRPNRRRSSDFS